MGRRRRLAAHLFHRPPPPSAMGGLIGSTQALAQPVLHQSSRGYQETKIDDNKHTAFAPHPSAPVQGVQPATPESPAKHAPLQHAPQHESQTKPVNNQIDQHHSHPSHPQNHPDDDNKTTRDPSIWSRAFHHFMENNRELASYYAHHLDSLGDDQPPTARSLHDTHTLGDTPTVEDRLPNSPPTTLQKMDLIVKKLHHHREQRQWKIPLAGKDIKIREQAEKFAKFLLWSDPIVKDALSAQPYAALAWSGVSFLLSLLTTGTSQHASMLQGFDIVNDTLVYWQICEETYLSPAPDSSTAPSPEHTSLTNSLTRLYALLIEYQALAIAHLSRSQLTRAFEKIVQGNEWADRISQIEVDHERCRRMIDPVKQKQIQDRADESFRVMKESKEILSGIREALEESKSMLQRNYEDTLERNLLQDLAGDYEGFKNMGNPKRVEGTCEWFFGDDGFRHWRDGNEGLLWVTAGPGSGKSVLARALVDEGRLTTRVTTTTVAHFFFKNGDKRRVRASSALAALVHQIFTLNGGRGGLMEDALRRHRSHGPGLATNFSELWGTLSTYVASPDSGEVICVLDALDECDEEDRKMLLEHIRVFYLNKRRNTQTGKLKFLITSRPHGGIEAALNRLSSVGVLVHIDGDGLSHEIGDEINLVIDDELSTITAKFSEQDQRRISEKLKSMKHRTYLWLHLTLDIIRRTPSKFSRPRDLENFLAKLPSEVSDAYEQILSRSDDRHQTETLLDIVVSAQRPLTLDEANIAMTLALADTMPSSVDELKTCQWPEDAFKGVVQSLCGSFVAVSDGKLSLIHQTARDFLLDPSQHRADGKWRGSISLPNANNPMSHACLHYLSLLADHTSANADVYLRPEEYQHLQTEHPFLSYAAAYWPIHYVTSSPSAQASANTKSPINSQAIALCSPKNAHIWAPQHFARGSFLCWWTWNNLALASYVGLAPIVDDLLSLDGALDLNSPRCSDFGTGLQTAAAGGHESVARVLLKRGAMVDLDGNSTGGGSSGPQKRGNKGHGTALRIAAARGHKDVVKLLLDSGADLRLGVRGDGRGTALEAAKSGGHEDVVQILRQAAMVAVFDEGGRQGIDNSRDTEDDTASPILPGWFGHEDIDEPPHVEMPTHGSWDDDDDPLYFKSSPPSPELADAPSPVTPLQRATTLPPYIFRVEEPYELLEMSGEPSMPVPWPAAARVDVEEESQRKEFTERTKKW